MLAIPDADGFCDAHPQLMTRHIAATLLLATAADASDAKTTFVEPDLAPLPKLPP